MKKNNIPKIRFKGFVEDWEETTLGDCADIVGGGTPSTGILEYWDGDINWYSPAEIGEQNYVYESKRKISELGLKNCSAKVLPIGTILFSSRAGIGNTAILAKEGATNQGFQSIVPFKNKLDTYFIYSRTRELKKYGETNGAGTTFIEISGKQMERMGMYIPKINEQTQIGNFFLTIDKLIIANQRKINKLNNIKKACLEKMFPKKGAIIPELRFKGYSKKWEENIMNKIGSPFTGLSGKTKEDFGHGNAEFITYMNIYSNPIANLNGTDRIEVDNKQNQVQYGDILFTTSSETPEEVGMSSVWLSSKVNVYLNSFCFGYRLNENKDYYYIAYLLRSPLIRKKITFLAQGISRYNISKNKMLEIELPFPVLGEQEKIGTFFKNLDNLIIKNEQQLNKLVNIKKACLEKMFVNKEDVICQHSTTN